MWARMAAHGEHERTAGPRAAQRARQWRARVRPMRINDPARCVRVRPSRAVIRLLLLLARVGVVAAAVLRQEQLRHVIWP